MSTVPEDSHDSTRSYVQLANGTIIGHYRLLNMIGVGGMGEVYLAQDTALDRKVALKFLPAHLCRSEDCCKRFIREAQAAAKLDHPNIVSVFEVSEFQGRPFFAMQLTEGPSLRELIKTGEISPERAIDLVIQICEGLHKAHQAGIIHRDIKPSNVLMDADGRPRIADFGLASYAGSEPITKAGARLGTMGYMSPEQLRGDKTDHRTDLFSLGIVLYELVAARHPFAADSHEAMQRKILCAAPEPLARYKADVPAGLQNVVDRALEKDVAVRYQSAADMMADLRRLRRRSTDVARAWDTGPQPHRRSRVPVRYILPAVVLVLAAIGFWWTYHSGLPGRSAGQNHLAVIPFANLASQSTNQAFCDGLVETITSKLTQLSESGGSLLIVPASEVRGKDIKSAAQARKVFGANLVVTGSVQQLDYGIRTTLNLVDAATERQLRSTVIDQREEDIASLQDESVAEVARLLDIQLRPESRRVLDAGGTTSSNAYRAYLEGRGYLQRCVNTQCLDSAQKLFNAAIEQDSGYALAFAALGETNWRRFTLTNDASWIIPAENFSSRALELNDRLAPVLITLGIVHRAKGQYQEAVSYLKRALQIDSVDNTAYVQLASAYESLGRVADAESTYQRSVRLRPQDWRNHYQLARFYAYQGRKPEAQSQAMMAESVAPAATFPYMQIGSLYTFLGAYDRAKVMLQRQLELEPNYVAYQNLGAIYQMEGQNSKAVDMYEHALKLNDKDYRVWSTLAWMYKTQSDGQEKARAAYDTAITLAEQNRTVNPNDPALLCYLADCYWQVGEHNRSLALAQQAVQLSPEDIEVTVRAGIIFEEAGRRDEALILVGRAVRKGFPVDRIKDTKELRKLVSDPRFDSILAAAH